MIAQLAWGTKGGLHHQTGIESEGIMAKTAANNPSIGIQSLGDEFSVEGRLRTGLLPAVKPTVPTVQRPPVVIPAGTPSSAALELLKQVNPSAASETRGRIAALGIELADLIETTRLHTDTPLPDFLRRAGRAVKLRATLEGRLKAIDPGATVPTRASSVEEVCTLVGSVRRWRRNEELRTSAAAIVARLRGERDAIAGNVQALVENYRAGTRFVGDQHKPGVQSGLGSHDDLFLARMEALLEPYQALTSRIDRLDAQGDAGRAAGVAAALDHAGIDQVVSLLAPSQPAASDRDVRAAAAEVTRLDGLLATVDPETRKASALKTARAEQAARLEAAQAAVKEEQLAAAGAILTAAGTGESGAVAALQTAVKGLHPGLAEQLALVRGGEDALIAAIGELIAVKPETPTEAP
jgi:hypothetical protein